MSCGKVVLATANTALESVINHPECGIVTEYNADIYTNELQRLLNNMDEIKERGDKCYEFAKNAYRNDLFFSGLISIYNDVIKRFKSSSNDQENKDNEIIISQLKKYYNDKCTYEKYISNQNLLYKKIKFIIKRILSFFLKDK